MHIHLEQVLLPENTELLTLEHGRQCSKTIKPINMLQTYGRIVIIFPGYVSSIKQPFLEGLFEDLAIELGNILTFQERVQVACHLDIMEPLISSINTVLKRHRTRDRAKTNIIPEEITELEFEEIIQVQLEFQESEEKNK